MLTCSTRNPSNRFRVMTRKQVPWIVVFIETTSPRLKEAINDGMDWTPSGIILDRLNRLRDLEARRA